MVAVCGGAVHLASRDAKWACTSNRYRGLALTGCSRAACVCVCEVCWVCMRVCVVSVLCVHACVWQVCCVCICVVCVSCVYVCVLHVLLRGGG